MGGPAERLVRGGLVHRPIDPVPLEVHREVGVDVGEPGEKRHVAQIDHPGALGIGPAHTQDLVALHRDDARGHDFALDHVEHPGRPDHGDLLCRRGRGDKGQHESGACTAMEGHGRTPAIVE